MLAGFMAAPLAEAAKIHPDAGKTSAAFLKISPSARASGLAGASTALSDDIHAAGWNPAGLAHLKSGQAAVTHNEHVENLFQDFIGYAGPLNGSAGWALHVQGFFIPADLEKRSGAEEDPMAALTSSEGKFGANDAAVTLAYGRRMTPSLYGGVAWKFLRQTIGSDETHGYALDLGGLWKSASLPVSVGAALLNLGPALRFDDRLYSLPTTVSLGASWSPWRGMVLFSADIRKPLDDYLMTALGVETRPVKMFAVRAGYQLRSHNRGLGGYSGFGAGFGFQFRSIQLDYAFSPYGDLGDSHQVGLIYRLPGRASSHDSAVPVSRSAPAASKTEPEPMDVPVVQALQVSVKPLRISAQGSVYEVLATADPGADVARIIFQTRDRLPSDGGLFLEERKPPKALSQAGVTAYREYRLTGGAFSPTGAIGVAFRVPMDWLMEKGLMPEKVGIYSLVDGVWQKQSARLLSVQGSHAEFRGDVRTRGPWVVGAE